jgi:two-component system catabolic regulation response regulator CreB
MATTILIIEDEPAIADNITYALRTEGYAALWCGTGAQGLSQLQAARPALVILDVGLPDINGFELCKQIRQSSAVPVIFLTARSDEIDRVVGLEIGADDYMVKPFSPRELTARVRAVLRRTSDRSAPAVSPAASVTGIFVIDETRMMIRFDTAELELSPVEFRLLRELVRHPGRVFSRQALMQAAWDEPDVSLERTVDTHIKMLRAKLKAVRPDLDPIETRRGFGYCLRELS